jgi:hypothetical protein
LTRRDAAVLERLHRCLDRRPATNHRRGARSTAATVHRTRRHG